MKTVLAPRASAILYDVLVGLRDVRPFLLPANICPIVPITFFKARVPFEFVDISAQTLHMDLSQVEARLRSRADGYHGLLYSHTYGEASTPHAFFGDLKARFPDFLLVDDRCLCVPDLEPDPSTAADVTLYSTGYGKIVDIGSGGYAFLADQVPQRHQSLPFRSADLIDVEAGYKACIEAREPYIYIDSNWLQTESPLLAWPQYRERVREALVVSLAHKQAISAVYNSLIPLDVQFGENYQLWRFNLHLTRKKVALEAIFAAGLFASSHYASLVDIMGTGDGRNARDLAGHVINLFNDLHYTVDMAERTAKIVQRSL
jgi:hypothetical protein